MVETMLSVVVTGRQVMDKGNMVEFESPAVLQGKAGGHFANMIRAYRQTEGEG